MVRQDSGGGPIVAAQLQVVPRRRARIVLRPGWNQTSPGPAVVTTAAISVNSEAIRIRLGVPTRRTTGTQAVRAGRRQTTSHTGTGSGHRAISSVEAPAWTQVTIATHPYLSKNRLPTLGAKGKLVPPSPSGPTPR